MAASDVSLFLREWVRNPGRTAAVQPSSRSLAAMITKNVSWQTGPVLELGPGTGVFTQALLDRGVREENLTLVEFNPVFARLLQDRFPLARTLQIDAELIHESALFEGSPVGAVICGLGLLNMTPDKVARIVKGALSILRGGGEIFLFTYGLRCPIPDEVSLELDLESSYVGRAYLNVPPAAVWRISRKV